MAIFPWKRGPQHKRQKGDQRLEDQGFPESTSKDEAIFDRSYKINPTRGKRNPRFEPTPDEAMFRLSRRGKIERGT
jgi:hypothetical protein